MYLVTIINNGVETAINEVSTKTDNRISGTIKQGINTINSFTFTILPNNIGYNLINTLSTLVKVLNTKTNKYEFIGRVLSPTHSMDSNGLISKSYVCESELGYLLDTYQSYEELHNITVKGYLERLIQVHNNNTDSSKKFTIGNVTVVDNNDSLYRYIAYDTTKKNIDDDLIDKLGGELQIRYENDIRYLDYLTEVGKVCSTEIRLAKNLQDLEQNIDVSNYCNRLVVLGAKLKVKDDEGNETDTEERLTIESINNGLKYIDDKESIAKYGVIQGQVIYDDVTDAKNLLSKGQKYLLSQRLSVSNKVNALDLSLIGIDIDSFEVGNYYPLIHEILGINDVVRVVEKSISIDSPHTNSITLGDLEKDIKKYNIQAKKGYAEAIKLNQQNSLSISKVEKYTVDEIYRVDSNVNKLVSDTGSELSKINDKVDTNNSDIKSLKIDIEALKKELSLLNNDYLFSIEGKVLNSYKEQLTLSEVTVMQSFDIDINTNDIYTVQLKKGSRTDLVVTRLNSSGNITESMTLNNFGHGTNMAIEQSGNSIYIWTESDSILDSDGDGHGTKISRIKFENGVTHNTTSGNTFNLLDGHVNLSPSIDKINNRLCIRSRFDDARWITIYNLNSVMSNSPIKLAQFKIPETVMTDYPLQGHEIYNNYVYIYEGEGKSDAKESIAYITALDFKGNIKYRSKVEGFESLDHREAEGIKLKKVSDKYELYIGFASGEVGNRKANIYKYIDNK